jgi:hypothetical protein
MLCLAASVPAACTPRVSAPATPVGLPTPQAAVPATLAPVYTLTPAPAVSPAAAAQATIPGGPLAITSPVRETFGLYDLVELAIQSEYVPANPFDPGEFEIRVTFTSASGRTVDVGAFWYQEYSPAGGRKGDPGWRARFTPPETGTWTAAASVPARGWVSPPVRFTVVESAKHGFVRTNPNNPRYFAFDDGSFFYPIGLNLAWWSGAGSALGDYKKWMDLFSANGGDTIRVWMAEWSFGIEWSNTPLGDYTNRMQKAWLLDQIFFMADERDMYVLLVLQNCADFNNWQTKGWNSNPYNAANGGPLDRPQQFLTDPTARALLQRRINYIVNRWGYSPRLLAWEWWNEANLGGFSDAELNPWLQEMTDFLLARDPNRHLVTNSYAISDTSPAWLLPEMEIIQKHEYALQEETQNKDLAERVTADLATLVGRAPPKPALMGEFGWGGGEGFGNEVDRSGIHLHNGLWATTFGGYAGSGMYWWWDVYVEKYRLWYHFRGLEKFLTGVDLSRYQPFSPLEIRESNGGPGQAFGMGLRGEDVLVWLRSDAYTQQAAESAWSQAGSPGTFTYLPPWRKGQVLILAGLPDGDYTVRWFLPQTGRWLDPVTVTVKDGNLSVPIPDYRLDMAGRISAK